MTASSYFKFSTAWPEGGEDVAEISLRVGDRSHLKNCGYRKADGKGLLPSLFHWLGALAGRQLVASALGDDHGFQVPLRGLALAP